MARLKAAAVPGNTLQWVNNAPADAVLAYHVWVAQGTNRATYTALTNSIPLTSIFLDSGTYVVAVSAINAVGESRQSTNLTVVYQAHVPQPPTGLHVVR